MAIDKRFLGREYGPFVYEAGLEKMREFAFAVGGGIPSTGYSAKGPPEGLNPVLFDEAAGKASSYGSVIGFPSFAVTSKSTVREGLQRSGIEAEPAPPGARRADVRVPRGGETISRTHHHGKDHRHHHQAQPRLPHRLHRDEESEWEDRGEREVDRDHPRVMSALRARVRVRSRALLDTPRLLSSMRRRQRDESGH